MLNQLSTRQWPLPGYAGDFPFFGPMVVKPVILKTSNSALNVPGVALTFQNGSTTNAVAGGAGVFAGILSNKNTQPYDGNLPTGPVLNIPNDTPTFATSLTTGVYATLSTTARVGDGVAFNTSTGVLAAAPGGVAPNGHTVIPGAVIFRRNVDAAGAVGIVQLSSYVKLPLATNELPAVPDGVFLANYTTASRAFPNGMADLTDDPYPGKTSNVTASLNPGNTVNIRPLDISPTVIDLRGGMVSIAFKITPSGTFARAVANLGNCYVNLYNNASPSTTQTNYMRVVFGSLTFRSERIVSGWNVMRFPIEMFGTVGTIADVQAYLQSVRYAGIEFNHNSTNTDPFQVSVDFSKTFANPISKGMVILGFDDCRRDTYAYAYPKMKAYGFPGVLYPGAIDATLDKNNTFFMNTANVLEMQADGWQTAYQAWDTESPTSTLSEFSATMDQLIAFYPTKGFNGPNDGSYFSNISFGSMYQPAFDSHFRTMRDYMQFNDAASPRPDTLPPADVRKIRSYGVNTAANSATNGMIPYAKRAASMRAVGIYVWHALGSGDAKLAADGGVLTGFEALLEWLNSAEGRATVDVVTFDEAVRRWRAGSA